jgi:hypothetical protein
MQLVIRPRSGRNSEPDRADPGNDGICFMGYAVTSPSAGVWHYEYALYNINLDRVIQSLSVPVGRGVSVSNIGFHAKTCSRISLIDANRRREFCLNDPNLGGCSTAAPLAYISVYSRHSRAERLGLRGSRSRYPATGDTYVYRMPESHCHWTFVIWPATTSTSNGPK